MNVFLVGIDVQTTDVRGVPSRLDQQFLCGCRLVCVESGVESRSTGNLFRGIHPDLTKLNASSLDKFIT
jgi:hypothetical protein